MFRDQLEIHSFLVSQKAFETMQLCFTSSLNPITGKKLQFEVSCKDFIELKDRVEAEGLFKQVAYDEICS